MFQFPTIGRNSSSTEVQRLTTGQLSKLDSWLEGRKAKKEDKSFSSPPSILLEVIRIKKNQVKITQNQEMSLTTAVGDGTKMLDVGLTCHEHKIMDCNSGRQNPTPLKCMIQCQKIASRESSVMMYIESYAREFLHLAENISQKQVAGFAAAAAAAAATATIFREWCKLLETVAKR